MSFPVSASTPDVRHERLHQPHHLGAWHWQRSASQPVPCAPSLCTHPMILVLGIGSASQLVPCAPSSCTQVKRVLAAWIREIGERGSESYNGSRTGQVLLSSGYNVGSTASRNSSSSSSSRTLAALVHRWKGSASAAAATLPSTSILHPIIPVFGLGASSGGAFILLLAMNGVHFAGLCSE
eukprot:scaffold43708_cov23-Tisochrysis_lutea.AAC.3